MKKFFSKKASKSPQKGTNNDDGYQKAQDHEDDQKYQKKNNLQDYFPTVKIHYWRKEHLDLRKIFKIMFFIHIVFLILADFYAYNFEVLLIIADIVLIWLDYYNFMTLKKIPILAQCGLQGLVVVVSLSHAQRLFSGKPGWIEIFFYLLQFIIVYPLSLALILKQFKIVSALEREIKDEKLKQTFKGKVKLKIREKAKEKMPGIFRERIQSFLNGPLSDTEPENDQKQVSKQKSNSSQKNQKFKENIDQVQSEEKNEKKRNFIENVKRKFNKNKNDKINDTLDHTDSEESQEHVELKETKSKQKYKLGDGIKTVCGKIQEFQEIKKEKKFEEQKIKESQLKDQKLQQLQNDFQKWIEEENVEDQEGSDKEKDSKQIEDAKADQSVKQYKWGRGKLLQKIQKAIKDHKQKSSSKSEIDQQNLQQLINIEKEVSQINESNFEVSEFQNENLNQENNADFNEQIYDEPQELIGDQQNQEDHNSDSQDDNKSDEDKIPENQNQPKNLNLRQKLRQKAQNLKIEAKKKVQQFKQKKEQQQQN